MGQLQVKHEGTVYGEAVAGHVEQLEWFESTNHTAFCFGLPPFTAMRTICTVQGGAGYSSRPARGGEGQCRCPTAAHAHTKHQRTRALAQHPVGAPNLQALA